MRFQDTNRPLLLAPLGSMGVHAVLSVLFQGLEPEFLIVLTVVGVWSLVAGLVFVVPVLVLVPRLRQPSLWVAIAWGVAVAWCVAGLTAPVNSGFQVLFDWKIAAQFGAAGAASGTVYAMAARHHSSAI
jgi:hypothetical protein